MANMRTSDQFGPPLAAGLSWAVCLALVAACTTMPPSQSPSPPVPSPPSTPSSSLPSGPPPSPGTGQESGSASRSPKSDAEADAAAGAQQTASDTDQDRESDQQEGLTGAESAEQAASAGTPTAAAEGVAVDGSDIAAAQTGEGAAGESGPDGGKTDDEILAEALEQFGRGATASDAGGEVDATDDVANAGLAGAGAAPQPGAGHTAGATATTGELTEEEKKRLLYRELERQFAEFDKLMLGEREALARERKESGAAGEGSGYGDGGEEGGGEEMQQTALADSGPPEGAASRSSGVPGSGNSDIPTDIPPDIGSAQDDDIIARQLREAAMKERDPVLRGKLWDEYRKYKRGG